MACDQRSTRSARGEREPPCKRACLEGFRLDVNERIPIDVRLIRLQQQNTQAPQELYNRKRTRVRNDESPRDDRVEEHSKQTGASVVSCTSDQLSDQSTANGTAKDSQDPITYWSRHHHWPEEFFRVHDDIGNILTQNRSTTSRSSGKRPSITSVLTPSDQRPREEKSAGYLDIRYDAQMERKGIFMRASALGIRDSSKTFCRDLLAHDQAPPTDSLFHDDLFAKTCEMVRGRNEAKVVQDITRLIVPSAEELAVRGKKHLQHLIESVNQGWNNSIPVTKPRPQPDYAVGFRWNAFSKEQLDRMAPITGDLMSCSYFMATHLMYFPFLTCEVKCGNAALKIADRQNVHSMAIAVRAVIALFRTVNREQELHREILAFSISHDDETVRIFGHYAEIHGSDSMYYRHNIHIFNFTALEGKEKWTAYRFTMSLYENWMPMHFARICSAIDDIPPDISFSMSGSELHFPEQPDQSPQLGAQSLAHSNAGSGSAQEGDPQSSAVDQTATPNTSVSERGPLKKPHQPSTQSHDG